jgi:hypothetical protein
MMNVPAMAGDVEEPRWDLVDTLNEVEVRHYGPSVQAVTRIRSSGETSVGFRRLAGYIFGGNATEQKIAMTAPVQETLTSGSPLMTFTLPSEYKLEDLPAPNDDGVSLVQVPARTVAAVRFSGWATGSKVAKMRGQLLATLEQHQVEVIGEPVLNQYNPPWTAPFLRRNEIAVEVAWNNEELVTRRAR